MREERKKERRERERKGDTEKQRRREGSERERGGGTRDARLVLPCQEAAAADCHLSSCLAGSLALSFSFSRSLVLFRLRKHLPSSLHPLSLSLSLQQPTRERTCEESREWR